MKKTRSDIYSQNKKRRFGEEFCFAHQSHRFLKNFHQTFNFSFGFGLDSIAMRATIKVRARKKSRFHVFQKLQINATEEDHLLRKVFVFYHIVHAIF